MFVYSANFGDYDIYRDGRDSIYSESNDPLDTFRYTPLFRGKYYKMHPIKDDSLYIDANIQLNDLEGLQKLIEPHRGTNTELILFAHPTRAAVAQEFEIVSKHELDTTERSFRLRGAYRRESDSSLESQLLCGGVFWCKSANSPLLREWFKLTSKYTLRDQLTLPMIAHGDGVVVVEDFDIYSNNFFTVEPHK
jgi:hypothetical protein